MTEKEFKEKAKQKNVIIYSIDRVTEKENKGIKITYVHNFGNSTVSTEKEVICWNKPKEDVFNEFLFNHWAKAPTI